MAQAHSELRENGEWARALQCALALGNFLNHGTRLGRAAGVRLRSLHKMQVRQPQISSLGAECEGASSSIPMERHCDWQMLLHFVKQARSAMAKRLMTSHPIEP